MCPWVAAMVSISALIFASLFASLCHANFFIDFNYTSTEEIERHIFIRIYGKSIVDFETFTYANGLHLLNSVNFDKHKPTLFYHHGWTESPEVESTQTIVTTYLQKGGWNIVVFDYRTIVGLFVPTAAQFAEDNILQHLLPIFFDKAVSVGYKDATQNATQIGTALGTYIASLVAVGLNRHSIHVMGHSLGGQIISFVGKAFNQHFRSTQKIPRITALDPAGPIYVLHGVPRLEPSDAEFVDVIHTDNVLGFPNDMGHADFYPNNAFPVQPGCPSLKSFDVGFCSHQRSWKFYCESVLHPTVFPAKKCPNQLFYMMDLCSSKSDDSVVYMGYDVSKQANGRYYLETAARPPFGKGYEGLRSSQHDDFYTYDA